MKKITFKDLSGKYKSGIVRIPIKKIVEIVFTPKNYDLKALVVSAKKLTGKEDYSDLVYVEKPFYDTDLALWQIPLNAKENFPIDPCNLHGSFCLNQKTKKIENIYILAKDVLSSAYPGTLEKLLENPNIKLKNSN